MPIFHDQDRSSLRRGYVEAWRKRREALPLEPLEHQIADVVELHPEYHAVLEQDTDALQRDYAPEGGQSNPFLHMGMHLAIREQVSTNRPAGIAAIHAALAAQLGSVHEAEHRMIECLGEALWRSQRSGLPPDEAAYLEALRKLSGGR
ncbi:MAG: DUF1841 family protein [Steroidobacteraceae bacterium]|nr:DUF1841 family protein [Steroidobacteraceae bacterium]